MAIRLFRKRGESRTCYLVDMDITGEGELLKGKQFVTYSSRRQIFIREKEDFDKNFVEVQ